MRSRHLVLGVACAATALAVAACGSSGGNSRKQTQTVGSTAKTSAASGQCAQVRSKYPSIPKAWTVAISPYNGALEEVDPKNPDNIIGIEPDLVHSIASCLGTTVTLKSQPFASVINSLTSGVAQIGLTGLFVTPARTKIINLASYMQSVDEMYTLKDNANKLQTPDDMCGKTIGETIGTAEADYVKGYNSTCESKNKPKINISLFQDIGSLYSNIENKRIDGAINSDALEPLVNQSYHGKIVATFKVPSLTLPIGIGISNKTADSGLPHAVADVLTLLHDNGTTAKLLTKWTFPSSALIVAKLYGPAS